MSTRSEAIAKSCTFAPNLQSVNIKCTTNSLRLNWCYNFCVRADERPKIKILSSFSGQVGTCISCPFSLLQSTPLCYFRVHLLPGQNKPCRLPFTCDSILDCLAVRWAKWLLHFSWEYRIWRTRSDSAFPNGQICDISEERNILPMENIFIGAAFCQGFWIELPDGQDVWRELLQQVRSSSQHTLG